MADNTDVNLIPDFLYTNAAAVFQHVDQITEISKGLIDGLIVGEVASVADFYWIESERDQLGRKSRLFYLPDQQCALVTIPTLAHEQAHSELYGLVYSALKTMGSTVINEWKSNGGTTYRVDNGSGFSQSVDVLRIKARWWLTASAGRVKTVLLAKVNVEEATIIIEKWMKTPELTREQTIDIAWIGGPGLILETPKEERSKERFIASNGPLTIRFGDLMGRPPVEADGAKDIVIRETGLQEYAKSVWHAV